MTSFDADIMRVAQALPLKRTKMVGANGESRASKIGSVLFVRSKRLSAPWKCVADIMKAVLLQQRRDTQLVGATGRSWA